MSDTVAQIVALAFIGLFMWLGRKFDGGHKAWDTAKESQEEQARFAAHRNRLTESPLRLVKGEDFTPYDEQAFALDVDPRPAA